MWPFRRRELDPTVSQMYARLIELEQEWRAFLTQQQKWNARMAKRDRDALMAASQGVGEDHGQTLSVADRKALLRQRARGLMLRQGLKEGS